MAKVSHSLLKSWRKVTEKKNYREELLSLVSLKLNTAFLTLAFC